jgi:hypothetical protein
MACYKVNCTFTFTFRATNAGWQLRSYVVMNNAVVWNVTPCFLVVVLEDPPVFMLHVSSVPVVTILRQMNEIQWRCYVDCTCHVLGSSCWLIVTKFVFSDIFKKIYNILSLKSYRWTDRQTGMRTLIQTAHLSVILSVCIQNIFPRIRQIKPR